MNEKTVMNKKLTIGTIKEGKAIYNVNLEITLKLKDHKNKWQDIKQGYCLSICGDYYYPKISDIVCGGQMYNTLLSDIDKIQFNENWNKKKLKKLIAIWQKWHLNDCNAGTVKQSKYLDSLDKDAYKTDKYNYSHYNWACNVLKKAGLYETKNGYKYGHGWIYRKLPQSVIDFIRAV